MSSPRNEATSEETLSRDRAAWTRPTVSMLETGEAEAVDGSGNDSGNLNS